MSEPSVIQKVSRGMVFNFFKISVSLVIGLLYSIISVRWLEVYNFGVYVFLDGVFSSLAILYVLGTHSVQTRFIPELMAKKDYPRLRRLMKVSQQINFFSALVTFLVIFSLGDYLAALLGQPDLAFYIRLMSLAIVPGAVLGITKNILNAFYDQRFLSFAGIAFSIIDFGLLLLLLVLLELGLTGAMMLPVISLTLGAVLYYIRLRKAHSIIIKGDNRPLGKEFRKRIIRYALPLILLDFLAYFVYRPSQNLFLGFFRTMSEVTYFDVPYSFIQTVFYKIWLVIGGLGLISLVEIKTTDPAKLRRAIEQYVKLISLYVFPIAVGGFVLAESILTVLYGEQLLLGVFPFKLLLIIFCLTYPFSINDIVLYTFEKTSYVLKWNMIQTVLLIALNIVLIPRLGVLGAIIAISFIMCLKTIVYTYETMVRLRISNFMPIIALTKYFIASISMAIFLVGIEMIYKIENVISLLALIGFGFLVYLLGLRLIKAFDKQDKEILLKSNVPFKEILLKLL